MKEELKWLFVAATIISGMLCLMIVILGLNKDQDLLSAILIPSMMLLGQCVTGIFAIAKGGSPYNGVKTDISGLTEVKK